MRKRLLLVGCLLVLLVAGCRPSCRPGHHPKSRRRDAEADYGGKAETEDTALNSMPGSSMVIAMTDGSEVTVTTGTQTLLVASDTPGDRLKTYQEPLMTWLASGWKDDIGSSACLLVAASEKVN